MPGEGRDYLDNAEHHEAVWKAITRWRSLDAIRLVSALDLGDDLEGLVANDDQMRQIVLGQFECDVDIDGASWFADQRAGYRPTQPMRDQSASSRISC